MSAHEPPPKRRRAHHEHQPAPQRVLGIGIGRSVTSASEARREQPARQRFLGMPLGDHRPGEEPQRVLGVPTTFFEGIDRAFFAALARPWRRLGAYWRRARGRTRG